jgi:hypothetical protein
LFLKNVIKHKPLINRYLCYGNKTKYKKNKSWNYNLFIIKYTKSERLQIDLAGLYGIETRVLKQSIKRNLERFAGDDFMFELTKEELSRSQFVILNKGRGSNIKYLPTAFTELGVAMLSSVLNSEKAIAIN